MAIHVLSDALGRETPPHSPLEAWLRSQGYAYRIVPALDGPGEVQPLGCHRCTWNRRRALFETAVALGCSVVAFGHHAGDLAQTTLLNLLFHSRLETMAPVQELFEGRIRLIRPLCYIPEAELARLARADALPPPPPPCPQADQSQRALAKGLLRATGRHYRQMRVNLVRGGLD